MLSASDQIIELEGRPLPLARPVFRDGTRLRLPWARRGFEGYVPGFGDHLIGSYHGRAVRCSWTVDGKRLGSMLRPGVITIAPEHHDGHWSLAGPVEVAHVYLTNERLQNTASMLTNGRRVDLVPRIGFEDRTAATILRLLFEETDLADASSLLFVEQAIDLLCMQLLRAHAATSARISAIPKGGLSRRQVRLVTSYMREHIDAGITLTDLAALVQLSRFHFCRAFRIATGMTPHAWLSAERLREARALLRGSRLSIAQVALAVGYTTPSAFAASFRKAFGCSPTDLRREA